MLEDLNNQRITLAEGENGHILVLGKSGYGKSYFCIHQLEEFIEQGKNALIIDYSFSYSKEQLEAHHFSAPVEEYNPHTERVCIPVQAAESKLAAKKIASAISSALNIRSSYQKMSLQRCCEELIQKQNGFTFHTLMGILEQKAQEEAARKNRDAKTYFEKLMNRLDTLRDLDKFYIYMEKEDVQKAVGISLLQLSSLPEEVRKSAVSICLELLWDDTRSCRGKPRYDIILLDEFHWLRMPEGGAFESLLREGRKFGIRLLLSTQYICGYSVKERATLKQAGTMLFFHPADEDRKWIGEQLTLAWPDDCFSRIPSKANPKDWNSLLQSLKKGQAILYGSYYINDNQKVCTRPLIVRIA